MAEQYLADQLERETARRPGLTITRLLLHGPEVPELRTLSEDAQLLVVVAHGHGRRDSIGRVSSHLAAHARCPVALVRPDEIGAAEGPAPVVVGVDGSPASVAAVRLAANEASWITAPLRVVHARPVISNLYGLHVPAGPPSAQDEDEDSTAHHAAREIADTLRAEHPALELDVQLVDDDPAHALTESSRGAALLVVGSRCRGAFRGMLLGSVSSEVIRSARVTVLVVHGSEKEDGPNRKN